MTEPPRFDPGAATPPSAGPPPGAVDVGGPGGPPDDAPEGKRRRWPFLIELPVLVLIAFVLALLLKTFVVQAFYIPSTSMLPTLEVNDRILVNKVVPHLREPRRGEVVVFKEDSVGPQGVRGTLHDLAAGLGVIPPAQKDFVKRVIGLPGETLEVRGGTVYIDGRQLPEATADQGGYLADAGHDDFGPVDIPEGEYFLMGDNRPNSADSRSTLGTVPEDDIVGRAFVIVWPPGRTSTLPVAEAEPISQAGEGRAPIPSAA